jgi:hypothetical protein
MIPDLEAVRKDSWRHLMTGDESCFFFSLTLVECGLSPKMKWQQKLAPMSRVKIHVYNHV